MQEYSAMFHILNASIKASEQETTQIYLTSYKILSSSKLVKFKCLKVLLKILICFKNTDFKNWRTIYLCFTFFCKARSISIWRIGHCYVDIVRFYLCFTKALIVNTDSLYTSLITSSISLVIKKFSKHEFKLLLGLSTQQFQDLRLCQLRNKTGKIFKR